MSGGKVGWMGQAGKIKRGAKGLLFDNTSTQHGARERHLILLPGPRPFFSDRNRADGHSVFLLRRVVDQHMPQAVFH